MPTQKIIWTLLPNGINKTNQGDRLKLSVFVSPRLGIKNVKHTLKEFDFKDWPALLKPAKFEVESFRGPLLKNVIWNTAKLEAGLKWSELFGPETTVNGFAFNANRKINAFSAKYAAQLIKDTYQAAAKANLSALPPQRWIAKDETTTGPHTGYLKVLRTVQKEALVQPAKLNAVRSLLAEIPPGQPGALARNIVRNPQTLRQRGASFDFQSRRQFNTHRLADFYGRKEDKPEPPPPPSAPEIDFHAMLSLLGDAPEIIRRLGLVIDLEIPLTNELRTELAKLPDPRLRLILPPGGFSQFENVTPWTNFLLQGDRFLARPEGPHSNVANGVLDLAGVNDNPTEERDFDVMQMGVDDAALKLSTLASTLTQALESKSPEDDTDSEQEAGLPTLQSSGIALVRFDRDQKLGEQLQKASDWENKRKELIFSAEDLVRGYRVDILDEETGKWLALCQRVGTYTLLGADKKPKLGADGKPRVLVITDEGYVKSSTATSKEAKAPELYVHDAMFQWDGWSLCAPYPGRTIRAEIATINGQPRQIEVIKKRSEIVEEWRRDGKAQFPIEMEFRAKPGTLPRLRFGKKYRLRVRTVDLAGNSLPPDSALIDNAFASDAVYYARFEPVPPPAILLCDKVTEGESVERVVIRSNYGQTTAQYQTDVKKQIDPQFDSRPENERHVVPPKTSQIMAERHGKLDDYFVPGKYGEGFNIARREEKTLFDVKGAKIVTPPDTPTPHPTVLPLKPPTPEDPDGESLVQGQYVIYPKATLPLPYLPDPFARGATLEGVPGVNKRDQIVPGLAVVLADEKYFCLKIPFAGAWPEAQPLRLRVVEHPDVSESNYCTENFKPPLKPPVWDANARVLTVSLPKAAVVKVRYGCHLDKDDVEKMGLYQWLEDGDGKAKFSQLAQTGLNWMATPWRELVLVHAVQQPLCEPVIEQLGFPFAKSLGQTFETMSLTLRFSAISTGKLELLADWNEWMDDLSDDEPRRVAGKWATEELKVAQISSDLRQFVFAQHELGDTKFRLINYRLRATTRFREYFPPSITAEAKNLFREGLPFPGVPVQRFDKADEPDETKRLPGAQVLANQPGGQAGGVAILSSARPAAPKVVYVVPTFGWERSQAGDTFTSKRLGGGLRVYLERPWFSSGDGELLGVVLPEPFFYTPNLSNPFLAIEYFATLKPYLTQIGKDPIFDSVDPEVKLMAEHFKTAVHSKATDLDEVKDRKVVVAGHKVEYDKTRKLWFSDIVIAAGSSYYPFVRLALARYQPNSIAGVELSRVVMTDFAQLVPDRTATVKVSPDNKKVLTVRVTGVEPKATYVSKNPPQAGEVSGPLNNFIEVSVEARNPDIRDENLCWMPAPNAEVKFQLGVPSSDSLWRGTVTLPEPAGSKKYRVVIKEFEVYPEDQTDPNDPWKAKAPDPNNFWNDKRPANRLVYAETFEL